MIRVWCLGLCLAMLILNLGCSIGYNTVLFATKSNVGFNADTAPPVLEVDISRYEGVRGPTFEGGQTLPVMASFSSDSNAFSNFFFGVNQTFATGEAANTMTKLYDQITPDDKTPIPYEKVKLSQRPDPKPLWARLTGKKIKYVEPGEVKPVTFGTSTNLGVKVSWDGQTGQFPSAMNVGFKRKEATLAPVGIKDSEADIPSLLATIDTGITAAGSLTPTPAGGTPASPGVSTNYLQYFATGCAANNLARQQAVRYPMLKRANPQQKVVDNTAAEAQNKSLQANARVENNRSMLRQKTISEQSLTPPGQTTAELEKQIFTVTEGRARFKKQAKEEFINRNYPEYKNATFNEFVRTAGDADLKKLLEYLKAVSP
jgi:hypothetical protein